MSEVEIIDAEMGTEIEVRGAEPPAPSNLFRTEDPNEILRRATETATALSAVLKAQKLTSNISGREHVRVEGWSLLGTMLGVFPVCVWTRKVTGDIRRRHRLGGPCRGSNALWGHRRRGRGRVPALGENVVEAG